MILGQRLSVCFFLTIGLIVGGMNYVHGLMPIPNKHKGRAGSYFGYGAAPTKEMQNLEAVAEINQSIAEAEQRARQHNTRQGRDAKRDNINAILPRLEAKRNRILELHQNDEVQNLDEDALIKLNDKIAAYQQELINLDQPSNFDQRTHDRMVSTLIKQRERLLGAETDSSAQIGNLVGRGIGGQTWDSFGFQQADSFTDGLKKGLIIRATEAFGEMVSSKVKATLELVLGGTWDFMLLSGLDLWEDMCKVLFHDSKDPFKTKEVNGWKKLISEAMEQIEKNVKDGPKDSFRGHDMTRRSNFEIDEDVHVEATNNLNAWRMYIVGCAEQFDYFIFVLDSRKQYYKKDDIICFYAEQIQNRLSDYRALMLKAGSVKEFDEFIESNKSLLPAMRKNVEQLFTRLAEEVEPRTLGLGGGSDSMRRTDTAARVRPTSYDDNMPNHFSGGWPS